MAENLGERIQQLTAHTVTQVSNATAADIAALHTDTRKTRQTGGYHAGGGIFQHDNAAIFAGIS